MRRLAVLLGAVLALSASSTAAADTFRVVQPHTNSGGGVRFTPDNGTGTTLAFSPGTTGPMSFAALRGIWQAAGNTYGIPWEILAAINKVETNFGQNLGPSSAGAVGWMQFMPSTWARWGLDANGDGIADPNNPTDAIFSAARYLAACGGQFDIPAAVHCYNHSNAYVRDVLGLAAQYGRYGDSGGALLSIGGLQTQLDATRKQIAESRTQLASARAQAGRLAHAQRRYLRAAASAPLLSDRLEAQKHAVLLGVRRHAAESRAARLSERLASARTQLGGFGFNGSPFGSSAGLLSSPAFSTALSTAPQSGVVPLALQYLGVPYVWAGATPQGFDCSGLVQYVFAQLGVSLPHNTVAQWNDPNAVSVPESDLQAGDLVFFNGLDHVGIYIGGGYFIDAPHTGTNVRIDSLSEPWYAARYDGAKRIVGGPLGSLAGSISTMSFTSGGSSAFTSNVVYFTH